MHSWFLKQSLSLLPKVQANLPGCRSLAVIHRTRTTDPEEVPQVAFFTTDLPPEKGCAQAFGKLARGHWGGSEIRNHWVRDHCMREDNTRSKKYNINCALAGLRVCLITIKAAVFPDQSWPAIQEIPCLRSPFASFGFNVCSMWLVLGSGLTDRRLGAHEQGGNRQARGHSQRIPLSR